MIHAASIRMAEKTDAERIKGMQVLSDALDAQRKQTEDTWIAATSEMRTAWEASERAIAALARRSTSPNVAAADLYSRIEQSQARRERVLNGTSGNVQRLGSP